VVGEFCERREGVICSRGCFLVDFAEEAVDFPNIIWEETPNYVGPRVIDAPPTLRVIKSFLSRENWQSFVQFIALGVADHHGRVREDSGFIFATDLDPGDEHFDGVQLFDPIDTIYIREPTFDRLMNRYFVTIINAAMSRHRPELAEPWWPSFVATANRLRSRVALASD
jgi:hypothetical protein